MDIVIRATTIFFLIWLVTRGTGKRELAEITPFELVLLVIMGDLVQQGVTQDDRSLTGAVIAVLTITFWVLLFDSLTFRSKRLQKVFEGVPTVIVHEGSVVEKALAYERISVDEVAAAARGQGIGNLADVRLGVLEPGGTFSFILDDGPDDQQSGRQGGPSAS